MASRIRDGFDFYGAVTEGAGDIWTTLGTTTSLSSSSRLGTGQSLQLSTTGSTGDPEIVGPLGANSTTLFWNFAWRKAAVLGAANDDHRMRFIDGSTVQCSITFNRDGSIKFHRGDGVTLLGQYNAAFPGGGVWNHFQIKTVFNGATGSFEVRKDNSATASYLLTGVNNISTANAYANSASMVVGSFFPPSYQIDDFWMFDDTVAGVEPTTWIGDVRALQIVPNSDSAVGLSRSGGATNFSNINELTNNTANYVFGAAVGLVDEYGNAGFAVTPNAILGISVKQSAQKLDTGVRTLGARIRSGATVLDSAGKAVTTSNVEYAFNQDTDPNTGVGWTPAGVAAAKFGPLIVT